MTVIVSFSYYFFREKYFHYPRTVLLEKLISFFYINKFMIMHANAYSSPHARSFDLIPDENLLTYIFMFFIIKNLLSTPFLYA